MKVVKQISELTVEETIALLKQAPEQLLKTCYMRNALIIHLAVRGRESFILSGVRERQLAKEYLDHLKLNGDEADKRFVNMVCMA